MWRFIFSPPASVSGSALAASVCKKITGRLTSAIAKQEDVSVQLEALDIMADMLCRYVVRRSPMDGAGGDGWSFEFFSVSLFADRGVCWWISTPPSSAAFCLSSPPPGWPSERSVQPLWLLCFWAFRKLFVSLPVCVLTCCALGVSEDHHGSGPPGYVLRKSGIHRPDRAPPRRAGEEWQHVDHQDIHPVHGRHQQTGWTQDRWDARPPHSHVSDLEMNPPWPLTSGLSLTGEYLEKIIPLVVKFCNVDDDELREYCIQAFESFVRR